MLMFVLFLPRVLPERLETEKDDETCPPLKEDSAQEENMLHEKPSSLLALFSCIYGFFTFYLSGVFYFT